jgi:serine/threonine-protein kinase
VSGIEPTDPEVAALVRESRLQEAATLARTRGKFRTASSLFERACSWKDAADCARSARDFPAALRLYVEAKNDGEALAALGEIKDVPACERIAYYFEQRGAFPWAARAYEAAGSKVLAAGAWDKAGDAARAARLYEETGDVVTAARTLEAQIRREPKRAQLRVALGSLLFRYGKTEAAVKHLQQVDKSTLERRHALTILISALDRMGLLQAKDEASAELDALGGPVSQAEPEAPASQVKARVFGRYEVVREVASTPSARVLQCIDSVRGDEVAVKIFAGYAARGAGRDALSRFEREVKVLGSLDHPNVVPLYDYVPDGPALVMEWMRGGTLENMLEKEPIAPARAIEIACAVLSALGEAHRLSVIHRDVKPANVLFDEAGVAKLGDFGAAHLGDLSATATAGIIGTLGYMSPEQREGRPASIKSDLYGAGMILREMLTGERPSPSEPLRVLPSGAHRDLDRRHDAVVLALTADNPDDRPADAFAARRALTALTWPSTIERAALRTEAKRAPSEHPRGLRVETKDGHTVDTFLDRAVEIFPLDEGSLSRAQAFARADHVALQRVLRVDRAAAEIWFAEARGMPPVAELSPAQANALREALALLHSSGVVHGHVDREHVHTDEVGGVTLRFSPHGDARATIDTDRLALATLVNG